MQRPWKLTPSPEDLFIERYDKLLTWALHLTRNDRERAEDLLHDAFIQFTFTHPDVQDIHNLDGYLYGILRNIHVSQVRRAGQRHLQQLSIVEYDSALKGLRAIDPRDQIQVQDELRRICQYACLRKETAMAASVLILRFFHGYYPSEIARILRSSCKAVSLRLHIARREAKASLIDPQSLSFMGESRVEIFPVNFARTTGDLLSELRRTIFQSRRAECLSREQLQDIYGKTSETRLDPKVLAHIVSCPVCLDEVNDLLGLPALAMRYPTETLGSDTRGRGGEGGPGGSATGGGATGDGSRTAKTKYQHWKQDFFEHEPQELCISVNGYIQGLHKISSPVSEHTLVIDTPEKITFVEVLSEQGVRLVLLNVDESPPAGPNEQSQAVELSNDRSVTLKLIFDSPWPTVHVLYQDPNFIDAESAAATLESEAPPEIAGTESEPPKVIPRPWRRLRMWVRSLLPAFDWKLFTKPATVTALFALILVAAILALYWRTGTNVPTIPTATDLLNRSAQVEESSAARTDQVLHRTINLEEKDANGKVLLRRRVEVWQSAERGITARRLYDDRGALLAGDWRRSDGVQTLYHHGTRPQLQIRNPQSAILNFDDVWQLEPSAKGFSQLIGNPAVAHVEELSSTYLISYLDNGSNGLRKATLVLSRTDLHAVEQTVTLQRGNEVREFRFLEDGFERRAPNTVQPSVFEPEPELLGPTSAVKPADSAKPDTKLNPGPQPPTPAASTDLEVEVLGLLSQAGADLGEQVNLTRGRDGLLRIEGIVETDQRKSELMRALSPVLNNPAVKFEVTTTAEATRRNPSSPSSGNLIIQGVAPSGYSIPVDAELRRYFSGRGLSDDQVEASIRQFANRSVNRSLQALQHAWALKHLAGRFLPEQLGTLSPEARTKWLSMIHGHGTALQNETAALRRELAPVFFPGSGEDGQPLAEIANDSDLAASIDRLLSLCAANDKLIRLAFSISSDTSKAAAVKTPQFGRSLRSAELLAAKIARSQ